MTCVAGIIDGDKVYMASDGLMTSEDGTFKRQVITRKICKNDKYLIGFCGSIRQGQVFFPPLWSPPKNILQFPNSMIKHLEDSNCLEFHDNVAYISCNFLVGCEGHLYEINSNFQVVENIDNFSAIGVGAPYALASLYETAELHKTMNPSDRLRRAIKTSEYFSGAVGGEIHILSL